MSPLFFVVRRLLLVISLFSCSLLSFAQLPSYVWGRSISGGDYINLGYSVIDGPGNVYMAGTFDQWVDFDPGPDTAKLTSAGDVDAFVSKLDSAGNMLWTIQLGGLGADRGEYVNVDALGNVYVTGSFSGTVDFDPGPGTASFTAAAGTDAFVAKYDAAGNYIWAVSFAESGNSTGKALGIDVNANVYVTGNFSGAITFTNGTSYTSLGGNDVFICKLNAAGGLEWGQRIGGSSLDNATGIVADATGNVFALGMFENGTIDLDPGPDTVKYLAGTSIVYLVKLNGTGGLVWAIRSFAQSAFDLKMDAAGNLYLAGHIASVVDFDPGPGTANAGVARTLMDYFWKLTNDGGYVLAKAYLGDRATGAARSASFDALGNIYTAGGTGAFNKWDNNGNPVWAYGYGVGADCLTNTVDAMQHVYTVGNFRVQIDLDPGPDTAWFRTPYSRSSYGIFVSKLSQLAAGPLPLTWINVEGHLNDRQQSTLSFTVNEDNVGGYTVEKSTDGSNFSKIGALESKGNGTHSYVYTESTALHQTAWYRILQTDLDGQSGYSAVVRIADGKARLSAAVYPVPSRGNVTLQIRGDELLHTKAILVDMKGHQVKSFLINDYNTPISLQNLPGGMYLLQLVNGSSLKIMQQQ
jgi:hypothetical protein